MQHETGLGIFMRKLCFAEGKKSLLKQKVADVENMFLVFNAAASATQTIFQPWCSLNVISTVIRSAEDENKNYGRRRCSWWYRIKLQTYLLLLSLRLAEGSSETSAADQRMERISWKDLTHTWNFPSKAKTKKIPPPTKTRADDNISTSLGAPKCEASGRMFIRKIYGLCDNVELRKQEWGMRWQALFISRSKRAIICSCKNFNHAACVIFHEMNYSFSFCSVTRGGCRRFCDAAWASP